MRSNEEQVSEQTVHTILNYYMTMATRQPSQHKSVTFKIQIPYEVLAKSSGVPETVADSYFGSALEVETTMTWVEHETEDVEVIIAREEGEEEEN